MSRDFRQVVTDYKASSRDSIRQVVTENKALSSYFHEFNCKDLVLIALMGAYCLHYSSIRLYEMREK